MGVFLMSRLPYGNAGWPPHASMQGRSVRELRSWHRPSLSGCICVPELLMMGWKKTHGEGSRQQCVISLETHGLEEVPLIQLHFQPQKGIRYCMKLGESPSSRCS